MFPFRGSQEALAGRGGDKPKPQSRCAKGQGSPNRAAWSLLGTPLVASHAPAGEMGVFLSPLVSGRLPPLTETGGRVQINVITLGGYPKHPPQNCLSRLDF